MFLHLHTVQTVCGRVYSKDGVQKKTYWPLRSGSRVINKIVHESPDLLFGFSQCLSLHCRSILKFGGVRWKFMTSYLVHLVFHLLALKVPTVICLAPKKRPHTNYINKVQYMKTYLYTLTWIKVSFPSNLHSISNHLAVAIYGNEVYYMKSIDCCNAWILSA